MERAHIGRQPSGTTRIAKHFDKPRNRDKALPLVKAHGARIIERAGVHPDSLDGDFGITPTSPS